MYPTPVPDSEPFHRYLNVVNGDHYYTTNFDELDREGGEWVYEGIADYLPTVAGPDTAEFHQYYNTLTGDHFYTHLWDELGPGDDVWVYQGVAGLIFRP